MPKREIEDAAAQMIHLKVKTQEDARVLQVRKIQTLRRLGQDVAIHTDATPRMAVVDWGRWIVDCDCGAGVAVHPEWTAAYCLGCGAILTAVTFPTNRSRVEAALVIRSKRNQFFFPTRGETIETLAEENREHGLTDDGVVPEKRRP